ncbi:TonB-dependent receptor plug domain-containing protein, partial [Bacteroides fragilis]
MRTAEVAIAPNIKVILKTDSKTLDEVMIVAYGTAKKSSFTGSASTIQADKIVSGSRESFDKALSGKMAGVRTASATGDPGSMGEINIRGVGSISGSKTPLYVIDGVVTKSDDDMNYYGKTQSVLSTLNPDDIESMTVLKDAAAASLYGSRAANGVVIITTKKGKEGKSTVTYSGEVGWNKMAVNQFKMMKSSDLIDYTREGLANYYMVYEGVPTKEEALQEVTDADMADFLHNPDGSIDTNWKNEIYRTAITQNHQVSINGGTQNTQFYAGVGYNKSEGIVLGSDFERISGRLNVNHKVNKWLEVALKEMVTATTQNGFRDQGDQGQGLGTSSPLGVLFAMDPTSPVKNIDGSYNENAAWGQASNPHLMLGGKDSKYSLEWIQSKMFRSLTNADVNIRFCDKLNFKTIFGYDYIDNKHFEYWDRNSVNGVSVAGMGSRYSFESRVATSSST